MFFLYSIKLRKITARVLETKSIKINNHNISLPNDIYANDSPGFNGDVSVNLLGNFRETITPSWTIYGTEPYPITVLSSPPVARTIGKQP